MSKLQHNIIACLPKNKNFQGVQRVLYCAIILNSKPEYLQYLPKDLFKSSKSSTNNLPLYGSFFVPLSTGGDAMFIGSDCMVRFLDFLKEINDTFLETIANLEGYEMAQLTSEYEQKHQESNTCVICGRDGFCDNNSCKGC